MEIAKTVVFICMFLTIILEHTEKIKYKNDYELAQSNFQKVVELNVQMQKTNSINEETIKQYKETTQRYEIMVKKLLGKGV